MRAVLAVLVALGASAAAAVPFVVDGPLLELTIEGPGLGASSSHAGHAGHGAHGQAASAGNAPAAHAGHSASPPPAGSGHAADHGAEPAAADAHAAHAATPAGDDPHAHGPDGPGMQRPTFPPTTGRVPASPDGLPRVPGAFVSGDLDLAELEGLTGSGTLADPYVLRGYHVTGVLDLADTDACIVLAENWFASQLALNWNGQCVWAHHNHIRDLRVNENIARTGYATGGLIEGNEIGVVGQLRHYDGEFRHNTVGPIAPDMLFDPVQETVPYAFVRDTRAANIDGFNQGLIHHNTFYGTVDLDFHGHHHGTGFFAPHSHYHGDSAARQADHMHDHSDRWTSVAFTDNLVVDPEGYGLRYEDQAHSGDDRRASSEDMDVLNEPHVHHTDIVLARNTIRGGQLWVDVFNADDTNHKARNPGTLAIEGNTVELQQRSREEYATLCQFVWFGENYDPWSAIHVQAAKEVTTVVKGNRLAWVPLPAAPDTATHLRNTVGRALHECVLWPEDHVLTAVRLQDIQDASILVEGNVATGFQVGVRAAAMDDDTAWRVVGNDFGKATPIKYDSSVEQDPSTA